MDNFKQEDLDFINSCIASGEVPEEFSTLIKEKASINPAKLRLALTGKKLPFPTETLLSTIEARAKTRKKLPFFITGKDFLFPSPQSAEQASHQSVALYHSFRIRELLREMGKLHPDLAILDMTAGLGIDAFTMALAGAEVSACELDPLRAAVLRYNSKILGIENFKVIEGDSVARLTQMHSEGEHFDVIFIDPARRDSSNARTYFLEDSLPDVTRIEQLLVDSATLVIIKASPILDIRRLLSQLKNVIGIEAVSVDGECKELLIALSKQSASTQSDSSESNPRQSGTIIPGNGAILLSAVDLSGNAGEDFQNTSPEFISRLSMSFHPGMEGIAHTPILKDPSEIKEGYYLLDPNASIHKLSSFNILASEYPGIKKLSPNTDLFLSESFPENDGELTSPFPGRVIRITEILNSKKLSSLKGEKLNVAVRNFPESAESLRRRLRIAEGSNRFLYAFRAGMKEKPVLVAGERINPGPQPSGIHTDVISHSEEN